MRSTRVLALAALMTLPLGLTAAVAAPAASTTGNALSEIDKSHVIDVRKGGGGGFRGGGFRGGGFRGLPGGRGFAMRGGGGRAHFRGGGPRIAGFRHRGPGRHWHGGHGHHHGHHHHHHRRWAWYGVPYYYDYWPDYYYNDVYYDDGGYDDDAVARCAARFRSFDPATGTYLHVSGERRRCPYL